MNMLVTIMVTENFRFEGGKGFTHLHYPVCSNRILELGKIGLQPLPGDKVKLSPPGLPQLFRTGFKFVRIPSRPHQINHLHMIPANLLNKVSKKRVQHRHLDFRSRKRADGHK